MLEKYRATIHGNTIEWNDEIPERIKTTNNVGVYITFVEENAERMEPNGKRAAEILKKIADRGGIQSIPDPDAWLREIRDDNILPGRE